MAHVHRSVAGQHLERFIATRPGVRGEVRDIRDRGASRARALFSAHDQPGGAEITTSNGAVDAYWSLEDTDSGSGEPAAAAIEYGWTTRNGRPVEGLHIIRRSAASL